MTLEMTTDIQSLLGDKAESLLGFDSPKIPKDRLHLPGRTTDLQENWPGCSPTTAPPAGGCSSSIRTRCCRTCAAWT